MGGTPDNSQQTATFLATKISDPSRRADLLQHLFDVSPLAIVITSSTGVLLEINERMQTMLGYSREELVGRRFVEITHPDDTQIGLSALKQLVSGEIQTAEFEKRYMRKSGEAVSTRLHVAKLPDDDGLYFVTHIEDITERKRQQQELLTSERQLRSILDAIPDALLRLDRGLRVVAYEPGQEQRGAVEHFLGRSIFDLFPHALCRALETSASQLLAGGGLRSEEFEETVGGAARCFEAKWTAIGGDEILLLLRDTTERRRANEERVQQREIIHTQRELLRQIAAPLIPIADGVIAMPLVGPITSERVRQLLETLLEGVVAHRARVVIVDVTGVSTMDTESAGELIRSAQAVQLLGAEVVLSGIGPDIAAHIVELGVEMHALRTIGQFQSAIAYALGRVRPGQSSTGPRP